MADGGGAPSLPSGTRDQIDRMIMRLFPDGEWAKVNTIGCVEERMLMSRTLRRMGASVIAGVWLALLAQRVDASDFTWNRTSVLTGNDWTNASYWTGTGTPPPGPVDRALFPAISNPTNNCYPILTNNAVVSLGGIFIDGNSSTTVGWQILNADSNNPATLVLGSMGFSNGHRCSMVFVQPDIQLAANQNWVLDPEYGGSGPTFYGNLTGTGSLTRSSASGGGTTYFQRQVSPTFSGGLTVAKGTVQWSAVNLTNASAGSYGFGTGGITLTNWGGFLWACTALTNNNNFIMNLTNAITVLAGGSLLYDQLGGSGYYPNCLFSGPISLGGILRMYSADNSGAVGNMPLYQGPITINQSNYWTTGVSKGQGGTSAGFSVLNLYSSIADGAGSARNPLVLHGYENELQLSGTNTYAYGTVVSACGNSVQSWSGSALVSVGAGSTLGTGNVRIEAGGRLRIYTYTNNNLAANATVTVCRSSCLLGVLSLGTNWMPAISSDSEGVLAVINGSYSNALTDLSTVGDGYMFLGTDPGSGTFVGTQLAPGAGNWYRLGGGNDGSATLTVNNGVLSNSASLQVGQAAWLGNSTVWLKGSNTFSGSIDVRGILTMVNSGPSVMGSTLSGSAQTQTNTSPFGSTNGAVSLVGSALRVYGVSGGKPVGKGPLTFAGCSRVLVDANTTNTNKLQFASLTRANNGLLVVNPVQGSLGTNEFLIFTNQADSVFLPPYLVYNSSKAGVTGPDFTWYDNSTSTGVRRFTAYNTNLLTSSATDVVSWSGALAGGSYTARALNVTNTISGTGTINLGDGTYAGLLLAADVGAPAINFGTSEGVIYCASTRTLSSKLSGSGGITVVPNLNAISITNQSSDFTGTFAVLGGTANVALDSVGGAGSMGNANNGIYLNGGILNRPASGGSGDRILASRTLTLGPCGGWLQYSYSTITIYGRITGPGAMFCGYNISSCIVAGSGNDYSGGTWVCYVGGFTVNNGSTLGTGPLNVLGSTATIQGDNGVCSTARVSVSALGIVNFQSPSPTIGSLEDCGSVVLGSTTNGTTLTVGGDNTSFNFYGNISQASGSYTSSVVKTGTGTFTLYGKHTYVGATTINSGALRFMGSLAGNLNVGASATLSGSGVVGGSLTNSGTWVFTLSSASVYDTIRVTGNVNLTGAKLVLGGAYSPKSNVNLPIIQAGSISGTFASVPAGYWAKVNGGTVNLTRASGMSVMFK